MALIDDILSLPPEILAQQDTAIIAAALPPAVQLVPTEIGNGTVLATLGLALGNALLDVLYTVPDFRYVKPLLEQGRLRIDQPAPRMAIDGLVGVVPGFTAPHAAQIKALAEVTMPVDEMAVRRVCWSDDGVWQL